MKQSSERASSVSNDYNPSERDDCSQNDENFDHKIEKTEVKLVKIQKTASQIEQSKIHRRNDVSMSNTLQTIYNDYRHKRIVSNDFLNKFELNRSS